MDTAPPPPPPPYPPPSPAQKQKRRMQQHQQQIGSISSILGNGTGINTPSESSQHQRQQIDPPPLQLKNVTDNDDNATRARQYKAEAYEAKIRIASQEQRIQELQAEIEEMRLFQKVDSKSSNNTRMLQMDKRKLFARMMQN